MIHESAPWKDRLVKDADMINRWAEKPEVTEQRAFIIEQKVFLGAYAMRKLQEGMKLSSSFGGTNVRCEVFSSLPGTSLSWRNSHRFDEVYDLTKPVGRSVGAPELLDTIIHSLLFALALNENDTVQGFYVTSDRRSTKLWLVPLPAFLGMMRRVAKDYPSTARMMRDPETDEWIFWQGHSDPPPDVQAKFDRAAAKRRR